MGNGRVRKRESKFTQVSNSVAQDKTLSMKAKGIYLLINSLLTIPDWILYKSYVKSQCIEGEKAFESTWKELKTSGYLIQNKLQDETGKIYYEYELLYEKEYSNHTPKKEGVENADVVKALYGKSRYGKGGVYNKTHTFVCDKTIPGLYDEIKIITGYDISEKIIGRLLEVSTPERIRYHLNNWHIHKQHQKGEGAGWFLAVVNYDIDPVEIKNNFYSLEKIPQRNNFEQREYSDDELEKFYANLTEV